MQVATLAKPSKVAFPIVVHHGSESAEVTLDALKPAGANWLAADRAAAAQAASEPPP